MGGESDDDGVGGRAKVGAGRGGGIETLFGGRAELNFLLGVEDPFEPVLKPEDVDILLP